MIINTPFKFGDIVYKIIPDNSMTVDNDGKWYLPYPENQLVMVTESNFFDIVNEWNTRYFLTKKDADVTKKEFELLCMSHGEIDRKRTFEDWIREKIDKNILSDLIKI